MVKTAPVLRLPADVNDDGDKEVGAFELRRGSDIQPWTVTGGVEPMDLFGSSGSGAIDQIVNLVPGVGEEGRKDIRLDFGAGIHYFEFDCTVGPGADLQWGDGSGTLPADGTGEHPLTKFCVFLNYCTVGTYDSRQSGTLEVGEYAAGESLDPLDVKPLQPTVTYTGDSSSEVTVSVRLIATESLQNNTVVSNRDAM